MADHLPWLTPVLCITFWAIANPSSIRWEEIKKLAIALANILKLLLTSHFLLCIKIQKQLLGFVYMDLWQITKTHFLALFHFPWSQNTTKILHVNDRYISVCYAYWHLFTKWVFCKWQTIPYLTLPWIFHPSLIYY